MTKYEALKKQLIEYHKADVKPTGVLHSEEFSARNNHFESTIVKVIYSR